MTVATTLILNKQHSFHQTDSVRRMCDQKQNSYSHISPTWLILHWSIIFFNSFLTEVLCISVHKLNGPNDSTDSTEMWLLNIWSDLHSQHRSSYIYIVHVVPVLIKPELKVCNKPYTCYKSNYMLWTVSSLTWPHYHGHDGWSINRINSKLHYHDCRRKIFFSKTDYYLLIYSR